MMVLLLLQMLLVQHLVLPNTMVMMLRGDRLRGRQGVTGVPRGLVVVILRKLFYYPLLLLHRISVLDDMVVEGVVVPAQL